ncbi:ABC transporter substrate-binding protein [Streptomyces johnsoniae]|uniref:ABC transporter substrate-binding protein n=1 Tax=Streptomyces johnsoniae TaxID=3075532 RepID=A0ABU2S1Q7_9ACTN|nr:ABC transporter substrate-binding protein [Streptomyces sp. DSM 41886]MDT0442929.1 ABC transporter substrate-binding protein [Streptomyces sp. DSM 41886]
MTHPAGGPPPRAAARRERPLRERATPVALPLACGLLAVLSLGRHLGSEDASALDERVVVGTTEEIAAVDPAAGGGPGSAVLLDNVFQSLLAFPPGRTEPQPDAAEKCGFTDRVSRRFTCTLRDDLTFTSGERLTAAAVKFSFDRTLRIDAPGGPAALLSSIDRIETPDEETVTFHLGRPDATFPQKIASAVGAIVDPGAYPADALRADGGATGSGPYRLERLTGNEAVLSLNADYRGPAVARNTGVTLRLFHGDRAALRAALAAGEVHVARGLGSADLADLEPPAAADGGGPKTVDGTGAAALHLAFNLDDPVAGRPGVRRAVAHLVDRAALIEDVRPRTAEPLYSVIPAGIPGHTPSFLDAYGDEPRRDRAEAALREAGITEPVALTLWITLDRHGPETEAAFEHLAARLNASGLFDAQVTSVAADTFEQGVADSSFGAFAHGRAPQYPDADAYTVPYFGTGGLLTGGYAAPRVTEELIPRTERQGDRGATAEDFAELQDIVAEDVPLVPLWQSRQYAVAGESVTGLPWALDRTDVFRLWEIARTPQD